MTKRIEAQLKKLNYTNQPTKFNLCVLILVCLCSFLIVVATFTQFDFTHYIIPMDALSYIDANFKDPAVMAHFLKHYRFIPQIPIIMFIVVLLGRKYSILSISLYLIAGIFFAPVFALGGGYGYIFQYGFGYILAYIPAAFFAGSILQSGPSLRNMFQATIVGVLTIHLIGILYMMFIATFEKQSFPIILGWITAQSGTKILYDLFFGFLAMILAKMTKKFLWVAMG